MVVQTLDRIPGHTGRLGLHVGRSNVAEFFPVSATSVELELDHLCIVCSLEPSFWEDRPEIHDARLSIWLEAKQLGGKLSSAPSPMALTPVGKHAFRLQVIPKDSADYALHQPSGEGRAMENAPLPIPPSAVTPVLTVDRRKRSIGHHPERRRIGKLKDNDSSAPAASH